MWRLLHCKIGMINEDRRQCACQWETHTNVSPSHIPHLPVIFSISRIRPAWSSAPRRATSMPFFPLVLHLMMPHGVGGGGGHACLRGPPTCHIPLKTSWGGGPGTHGRHLPSITAADVFQCAVCVWLLDVYSYFWRLIVLLPLNQPHFLLYLSSIAQHAKSVHRHAGLHKTILWKD